MVLAAKQNTPSKAAARKELARRKLAQQDLIRYGQYVMQGFRDFKH